MITIPPSTLANPLPSGLVEDSEESGMVFEDDIGTTPSLAIEGDNETTPSLAISGDNNTTPSLAIILP